MSRAPNRVGRPKGSGLLEKIASFATRRSRLVIGVWIVVVVALAVLGKDLDHTLTIHPMFANGSASERAHEISQREFGGDNAMVVMLRGPQAAVERQGRDLANSFDATPGMLTISPWARGASIDGLSPRPGVAAIVVRVESDEREEVSDLLAPVQRQVDKRISSPVRASIAGFPVVINSLRNAGSQATKVGELIAVPVLLLVLLLVFRSVLAALMPVIVGGAVVAATRGVLSLLLGLIQIDLFALGIVGMMGLALGVDYSLLVISRFREERESHDVAEAVRATVTATARSVIPAGTGLILAMAMSSLLLPGSIVRSVALAVIVATALSMLSAICVVPALLTALGDNLERWSLPRRRKASRVAPLRWSRRLAGHRGAVVSIMVGLLLLASWAFTLNSGAASIRLLPSGDEGRRQQEDVEEGLGPGWIAPMEVVVNGRGQPVTSTGRLRALAAFQHHVEADPGVETMAGLARLAPVAEKLGGVEGELTKQERGLKRLGSGITRIRNGAALNSSGLRKAAAGSKGLESGLGAANSGAKVLAGALQQTSAGSSQLAQGLGRADEGSGQLAQGTTKASTGAGRLADGLQRAREKTGEVVGSARLFKSAMDSGNERLAELHSPLHSSEERLRAAWQALQRMTTGKGDPEYAAVQGALEEADLHLSGKEIRTGEQPDPGYAGVESGIERAEGQFGVGLYLAERMDKSGRQASKGMTKLAKGAAGLDRGLQRLAVGSRQVSAGVGALAHGGEKLSPALQKLGKGAERLTGGLGLLETGAGRLAGGLSTGAQKSKLLTGALDRVKNGLEGQGGESGLAQIQRRSPGLFHSAYFVLAGLDGSSPAQRKQLVSLVNLDRGGMDARMLVIPRDDPTSEGAQETKDRLERDAEGLARKTGTEVVVGGVAPAEIEVNDSLRKEAPLMRIALSLISLIVLIPVMRSLTIPILAALINLVTVSASFGVLALLFDGSFLGGPGFVDITVLPATMMVMFGLAIDYEVFVFARIREEYVRTGSTDAAIKGGLDRTAHVVTGAAIIMISVFLAFSVSGFISIRNFGVAQAVAVFIDAFLIRLIVVPAMMSRLGKWCWWMPRWLDRLLPGGGTPVGSLTEPR
jgi:RND superfamily putative drug exporter